MPEVTADVDRAVAVLRGGGLVGLPTETVYGLAADAERAPAVRRVFAAKGRPPSHPLIVHLAGAAVLDDGWAAHVPDTARTLAAVLWPGPLTLLVRRGPRVLDEVTGGRPTVALRVPDHPLALGVLDDLDGGLVAPSANRFGRVSPTTAADVVAELGDAVDLVLDGGPCRVGVESTIVDLTGPEPVVLRPGGVAAARLAELLGTPVRRWSGEGEAVAPGMLPSHYAPSARVELLDPAAPDAADRSVAHLAAGRRVGVLAPSEVAGLPDGVIALAPLGDAEAAARALYARLREADALGLDVLVVVPPEPEGIGEAVLDRLRRAAAGR